MKSFISVLKNGRIKDEFMRAKPDSQWGSQLQETNCTGAGRKDLFKGTCTKGDKGYAGKA
jgi:hypothetical protein